MPTTTKAAKAARQKDAKLRHRLQQIARERRREERHAFQIDLARLRGKNDERFSFHDATSTIFFTILDEFAFARRSGEKSRTDVAVNKALRVLSDELLAEVEAIEIGVRLARQCLRDAWRELYGKKKPKRRRNK